MHSDTIHKKKFVSLLVATVNIQFEQLEWTKMGSLSIRMVSTDAKAVGILKVRISWLTHPELTQK